MCHNSLITGLVYETKKITSEIALEAIAEAEYGLGMAPKRQDLPETNTDEIIRGLQSDDYRTCVKKGGNVNG
jgi:hypothetical protein